MQHSKPITLYKDNSLSFLMFPDLVTGHGVQANQFMIVDNGKTMLLDPGGDLTYMPLTISVGQFMKTKELNYIFASHQDPDIIASIDRWLLHTECKVIISALWGRFLPHLVSTFMDKSGADIAKRIIEIPDPGRRMTFGNNELVFLPAHFLHSVGNIQVYDPVSKILFTGDVGASLVDMTDSVYVEDFEAHLPSMQGFHERYMVSGKVTAFWVEMVRELDVEMIVPQHGKVFKGKEMVEKFYDWFSKLECGIDLLRRRDYQVPE